MTKAELVKALEKYDDDLEICVEQANEHIVAFGVSEEEDDDGKYLVII